MKIFSAILLFISSSIVAAADAAYPAPCPTITSHIRCSTCAMPMCMALSTTSVPCGCPSSPATKTVSNACDGPEPCAPGGCAGTEWSILPAAATCSGGGSCPTITSTVTPAGCTPPGPSGQSFCAEQACIKLESVTLPCSCVGKNTPAVPTTTVTGACTCRKGCETRTTVQYLPCPATMPSPTPTDVGGGPGCKA